MSSNIKNYFLFFLILQRLRFSTQLKPDRREAALNYHYDDEDDFTMLISGGSKPTKIGISKYVASIRTANPTNKFGDNHYCTGVIVGALSVVTAAHCVVDSRGIKTRAKRIHVVAGAPNRLYLGQLAVEIGVDKVIPHENYERRKKNDIAMLRLKSTLPYDNEAVKIVRLASGKDQRVSCSVCGWGQLFDKGPYNNWAIETNLKIMPREECEKAFGDQFENQELGKELAEKMICARDATDKEKSVCRGDSGSPLICNGLLHGIASWNDNCGKEEKPSFFTNISVYREWIGEKSGVQEMQTISEIKLCITVMLAFALQKFCVTVSFL